MDPDRQPGPSLEGAPWMLIAAAIFGYVGFTTPFTSTGSGGQLLVHVPILEWTLKISAIVFVVSAGLTLVNRLLGNFTYGVAGVVGAVLLAVVAVMDLADTQHYVMSPFLLLILAAINGFGAWSGLRSVLAIRAARDAYPGAPDGT